MDVFSKYNMSNISCQPHDHMLHIVKQYTNETFWFPATTVIALVISYCVVIVAGLLGNILVIVVIFRKKALRSSRNIYILNLSICDVIMCSVCMPFSLAKLTLKKWTMGLLLCRIVPALATVDVLVSTLTMVIIAIDRYLSIVHSSQMTTRQVVCVLLVIWSLSILLSTPLFCFHKIDKQEMYEHTFVQQCIDDWPDDLFREIYTTVIMMIQYLTPSSVISCLHGRICKFLQSRAEDRPGCEQQNAARVKADIKRHRRNMILLTALALVFSITWLPLTLLNITADFSHEVFRAGQYNLLHAICLLLAMSSSAMNPIMYGWFNSNFRKAFCELLGFRNDEKFSSNGNGKAQKDSSNDKTKQDMPEKKSLSDNPNVQKIDQCLSEGASGENKSNWLKGQEGKFSRSRHCSKIDKFKKNVNLDEEITTRADFVQGASENSLRGSNERMRLNRDRPRSSSSYHSFSSH